MKTHWVLAFIIAAFGMRAATAQADVLWGVTNGVDENWWSGGQVFTVDTATGSVDVKKSYSYGDYGIYAFGDIAVSPGGDVFVTYYSATVTNFKTLAKVNTATWAFDWTSTLPVQVNALTFIGDTLYLHAGGGAVDGLYELSILDGTASPTFIGNSGYLGSDGDLAFNRLTNTLYNVYTPGAVGNLAEIDPATGVGTPVGTLNDTAKFGDASGGQQYGWGGLEFDSAGKLWAGSYWDQKLYSRNGVSAGGAVSVEYDLGAPLGGMITGLSVQVVPLPLAAWAGMGLLTAIGAFRSIRRRRA